MCRCVLCVYCVCNVQESLYVVVLVYEIIMHGCVLVQCSVQCVYSMQCVQCVCVFCMVDKS